MRSTSKSKPAAFVPSFEGPIEGYVVNQLKVNFWRVKATMEREDVMQEARMVFLKCVDYYPNVDPPHMMALFKQAWFRRFTDLAELDSRHRQVFAPAADLDGEDVGADHLVGALDNDGFFHCVLREAPKEVKMVLTLFLNAPAELLQVATKRSDDRRCSNRSAPVCRLLGLPEHLDVMQMTAEYLRP